MLEMIIIIVVVSLALLGVGYGLYRAASGKGCTGCRTCDEPTCDPADQEEEDGLGGGDG